MAADRRRTSPTRPAPPCWSTCGSPRAAGPTTLYAVLRPGAGEHPRRRHRPHRRRRAASPPTATGRPARSSARPAVRRHLERLPRHQRRLDRPARRRPARRPLHVGRPRATWCRPRRPGSPAGRPRPPTLALGFGAGRRRRAGRGARRRCGRGFGAGRAAYARGWHAVPGRARRPAAVAARPVQRQLYRVSAMVLAAGEDKTHRGAYVAAPAAPWAFGRDDPSGAVPPGLVARPLPDRHRR